MRAHAAQWGEKNSAGLPKRCGGSARVVDVNQSGAAQEVVEPDEDIGLHLKSVRGYRSGTINSSRAG